MLTRPTRSTEVNGRPFNNLLKRLNNTDFETLAPHLVQEEAKANTLLYNPGDDVETVYFPCGPSLVSYLVPNEDGRDVETVLIGREGAVGGIVSQGFLPAYTRIVVKFGGPVARMPVLKLEAAKTKSPSLRNIFARYADCMLAQIFQSTACNAIHSIEQRTAKWIVSAMERTDGDGTVPLTHEQLATLLGVISAAAHFEPPVALDPQSINAILKQRAKMAGLEPGEFSAHGLRSGYLTEAANRGIPLPEAMEQSRHRSVQQASSYYNNATRRSGRATRLLT